MSALLILVCIGGYFAAVSIVSYIAGRKADNTDNDDFFLAGRRAPWGLVAYGMIGSLLSGVTFISVPGDVGQKMAGTEALKQMGYMQFVFGCYFGYIFNALVLLPLYYRLKLTSIYSYLKGRFGVHTWRTGAFYFLLSRTLGASVRLFLATGVLHEMVLKDQGVPFWVTATFTVLFILAYTAQGGMKTLVWTDTFQTTFMVAAALISFAFLINALDITNPFTAIGNSKYGQIFFFDWSQPGHFARKFFSGICITIVMTGLDQDMMQKNLTCRNLQSAQKNIFVYSIVFVLINFVFVGLGALLYMYIDANPIANLPAGADYLFPFLALNEFSAFAGIMMVLGLVAAAYNSADGTLTALTTVTCVDLLNTPQMEPKKEIRTRRITHLLYAILFVVLIIFFAQAKSRFADLNVITLVFKVASITYGPLLGMYTLGLFTKARVNDNWTPYISIIAPVLCFILDWNAKAWFGFAFDFELIILNGGLTFLLLWLSGLFIKLELQPA